MLNRAKAQLKRSVEATLFDHEGRMIAQRRFPDPTQAARWCSIYLGRAAAQGGAATCTVRATQRRTAPPAGSLPFAIAFAVRALFEANRINVLHEEGQRETVSAIEADPAGNLIIWLE